MNKPTEDSEDFINKAAAIFAALCDVERDDYIRDPYQDGYISHLELDDRGDRPVLRMTYVFESVARIRQYWKAYLNDAKSISKDEDDEYDHLQDKTKVYDLEDLIPYVVAEAFPLD